MIASMNQKSLCLVDATISDLQHALSTGVTTCVSLVAAYLNRISTYDCRGPRLNAIPILNPHVFSEAAASDERRATGRTLGPLDGIPFIVKDSYKVKGLTVASGSLAFQHLIANEDAFTVHVLRDAGAVLIGKTNMCPMAAGGMLRGVYGRAESPYNTDYLAAAYASGSSNGSGVATGASLAAFGMGEETVSSGRSPASNNALVAYTPSRGAISIRGNWPLYPTCDVVVPHARTVDDLLAILDVIVAEDTMTHGDFYRDQTFIKLPKPWLNRPGSLCELGNSGSLQGLRIAVPSMYIGGRQAAGLVPVYTSPDVISLYQRAKADLETLGATVIEVDAFPIVENYELAASFPTNLPEACRLPLNWHMTERSLLVAYAWDQFLRENDDINIPSLLGAESEKIYPLLPNDDPQLRYSEPTNRIHYERLQSLIRSAAAEQSGQDLDSRHALMAVPGLQSALESLEAMRQTYFEDWLAENKFDMVAFPACGDVGKSDADINYESAEHAWRNGVKYSNGNRALRHVGIPSVTVPMGCLEGTDMPLGLTFLANAGEDMKLLQWASVYEKASKKRRPPRWTPELPLDQDIITSDSSLDHASRNARPELKVEKCTATPASPRSGAGMLRINIQGFVTCATNLADSSSSTSSASDNEDTNPSHALQLEILVDARSVPQSKVTISRCHGTMCGRVVYDFRCSVAVPEPPRVDSRNRVASARKIARDSTMVVVLARQGDTGWKAGWLGVL